MSGYDWFEPLSWLTVQCQPRNSGLRAFNQLPLRHFDLLMSLQPLEWNPLASLPQGCAPTTRESRVRVNHLRPDI